MKKPQKPKSLPTMKRNAWWAYIKEKYNLPEQGVTAYVHGLSSPMPFLPPLLTNKVLAQHS